MYFITVQVVIRSYIVTLLYVHMQIRYWVVVLVNGCLLLVLHILAHLQYNCPTHQDPRFCFYMWTARPWLENLPTGKWPEGDCLGQQSSPLVSLQLVTVATVRNNATVITEKVGNVVEIMLDIRSALSLLHHRKVNYTNTQLSLQGYPSNQLVSVSGESLPIIICVKAHVQMTDDFRANHQFLIVNSLIYPVILGPFIITTFVWTLYPPQ